MSDQFRKALEADQSDIPLKNALDALRVMRKRAEAAEEALAQASQPEQPVKKQWQFVESPGEFAKRMQDALSYFNGDMLAAVRCCLIESPPIYTNSQPQAQPAQDHIADAGKMVGANGEAHEIWAAAQLGPHEGITDGVDRIAELLRKNRAAQEPQPDIRKVAEAMREAAAREMARRDVENANTIDGKNAYLCAERAIRAIDIDAVIESVRGKP